MTTLQTDYLMVWCGDHAMAHVMGRIGSVVRNSATRVERVGGGVLRHTHRREVATRCLEQGCDLQVHRKQDWAHRKQDWARVCGNANVRSVVAHCVRRVAASMLPQLSVNRRLSVTKVRRLCTQRARREAVPVHRRACAIRVSDQEALLIAPAGLCPRSAITRCVHRRCATFRDRSRKSTRPFRRSRLSGCGALTPMRRATHAPLSRACCALLQLLQSMLWTGGLRLATEVRGD